MEDAYALIVGIANYPKVNPLPPNVLDDAHDVAAVLVTPAQGGYQRDNVRLLLDDKASIEALRDALATLAKSSTPSSTVFIYVSSHGERLTSGHRAGEYLLPYDVDASTDDTLAETSISGGELTDALRAIRARKLLVILDCCHSGGIGQPKTSKAPVTTSGLSEELYVKLQGGTGRVIMASSRDTEKSWVSDGARNSLFTEHLLAGLTGGIPSEDGLIRVFNLFEYLQPRVTAARSNQHPILKLEVEENFTVALNLGGQKSVVPKVGQGFIYDAYISYVDREPDSTWVTKTLVPRLQDAGLKVAISGDSDDPGVPIIVGRERGIEQAKRIIPVLSEAYLADSWGDYENVLAMHMGIEEGRYRLLPVKIEEVRPPLRLRMLSTLDIATSDRREHELDRLVKALQGPIPGR
jgi:hypothetical protein